MDNYFLSAKNSIIKWLFDYLCHYFTILLANEMKKY